MSRPPASLNQDGVDHVAVVLEQAELVLEDPRTAAGVDDPAGADGRLLPALTRSDRHPVGIPDLHVGDEVAPNRSMPASRFWSPRKFSNRPRSNCQLGTGACAVGPRSIRSARLAVVAGGEPEAQPALADLLALHVIHQPENLAEVITGDLLGRLPDLEGGLRRPPGALLGDEDARFRTRALELQTEGQPSQSTSENRDVVRLRRMLVVTQGALLSRIAPCSRSGVPPGLPRILSSSSAGGESDSLPSPRRPR